MITATSNFMDAVQDELNVSITENGAVGYKTTKKALLDMNFKISSYRHKSDAAIVADFEKAYNEDNLLALKWLFFVRDIRGGIGERRLFRVVLNNMAKIHPDIIEKFISVVPEFGRYDDLLCLFDTPCEDKVVAFIKDQIKKDLDSIDSASISLLGKWLPSINTSSAKTVELAKKLCSKLGMSQAEYRKICSKLRKKIAIVESYMSLNEWDKINYETVPSRANLIYKDAFLKHDEERRKKYLEALTKGDAKINASVLFPHDIVHKYKTSDRWYPKVKDFDASLEELWKNLPDYAIENTMVVADGSGSMTDSIGSTKVCALEVACALAIYTAERCKGPYKDTYITFSSRPQFVNVGQSSLRAKLQESFSHDECSNTNIEAVFNLILNVAIKNHLKQEEIPTNILIISDMEFDSCTRTNRNLFKSIETGFEASGYKMPRLIFWNVNSRTGTIPVKENDLGVALVSGFSPTVLQMVLSNKLDPYEVLLDILNKERYNVIEEIFNKKL